jgi:hypothetical protein
MVRISLRLALRMILQITVDLPSDKAERFTQIISGDYHCLFAACASRPSGRRSVVSGADYFKRNIHVAARCVGIGANLLVSLPHKRVQFILCNVLVLDAHLNGNAETAALALADRHGAGDLSSCGVAFLLLRYEIQRSPEAGSVTGGKEMLRRSQARSPFAAKLRRHAEVQLDGGVSGFCVAISAAYRSCRCSKKWVNLIHHQSPFN